MSLLRRINPWSSKKRRIDDEGRSKKTTVVEYTNQFEPPFLPRTPRRPLTPQRSGGGIGGGGGGGQDDDASIPALRRPRPQPQAQFQQSPFFTRLPAEIRSQILLDAFGEQTVHMDLSYRRPFDLAPVVVDDVPRLAQHQDTDPSPGTTTESRGKKKGEEEKREEEEGEAQGMCPHARLNFSFLYWMESQPMARLASLGDRPKAWRWFGCVCHRSPGPPPQSRPSGRMAPEYSDLSIDRCLNGQDACDGWPGAWPDRCRIGITGWLLSCRQAYAETIDVLYSTNTIHMNCDVLVRWPWAFIPQNRLAQITSLELRWRIEPGTAVEIQRSSWTGNALFFLIGHRVPSPPQRCPNPNSNPNPVFPALKYFQIHLQGKILDIYARRNGEQQLLFADADDDAEAMEAKLLPMVDDVITRFCPADTLCHVTMPYFHCDQLLHRAMARGDKFEQSWTNLTRSALWREIPAQPDTDTPSQGTKPRGYLIDEARLDSFIQIDEEQQPSF